MHMGKLRYSSGQLASFYVMYLDPVEIFFDLILADLEGDWLLHLANIRKMTPGALQLTQPTTCDISQCMSCRWHRYRALHKNSTIIF
jgi:hypothetical protein